MKIRFPEIQIYFEKLYMTEYSHSRTNVSIMTPRFHARLARHKNTFDCFHFSKINKIVHDHTFNLFCE